MPQTYVQLRDGIESFLQDSGNVIASTVELDLLMPDAWRQIATIVPYPIKVAYSIESRTGQATSTSANNLVDTTEGQFSSGDVGKVVYNATDNTWANITSYSSTSQVGLSKDIFTVNDNYKIFNKDCFNNKQINVSDLAGYVDIPKVQYPIGINRSVISDTGNPDIIEIDMTREPDDSKSLSTGTQPETEVLVFLDKIHKVTQLTVLTPVLAATCAVSATSISLSACQTSGTIDVDQEFRIANVRGQYWVAASATITANTAVISFYPPLESAVASTGVVVTLKQSTLTPKFEPPFVKFVAGQLAISKSVLFYQQINTAISSLASATTAIALVASKITAATTHIASGSTYAVAATVQIAAATADIASIGAEINKASSALTAGYAIINTVPVGGGSPEYMGQASSDIGVGRGFLNSGQGFLEVANADGRVSSNYIQLATGSLNAAAASLNEGMGNLRLVSSRLSVASGGGLFEKWGRDMVKEAEADFRRLLGVRKSTAYSRR